MFEATRYPRVLVSASSRPNSRHSQGISGFVPAILWLNGEYRLHISHISHICTSCFAVHSTPHNLLLLHQNVAFRVGNGVGKWPASKMEYHGKGHSQHHFDTLFFACSKWRLDTIVILSDNKASSYRLQHGAFTLSFLWRHGRQVWRHLLLLPRTCPPTCDYRSSPHS